MKAVHYKVPTQAPDNILNIDSFAGVNYAVTPSQIDDNECADILNFVIDDRGKLRKRLGYQKVFNSLGMGNINGMYLYNKQDGTTYFLFAYADKLYKLNNDNTTTLLYTGLANHRVAFFTYNNLCYLLDGTHYLQFDGTTVTTPTPYIPTMVIAADPVTGAGTTLEQFNLLGSGFMHSFTADGTTKDYQLCLTGLDATPVVASWDYGTTFNKVEGTDFAVNRTTGVVSFLTAPPKVNPDNVVIKAYKTVAGLADRIKQCTLSVLYGGANDTHIILSGNPSTPSVIYRSGVLDATYFPENFYQAVGDTEEAVTGFAIQYDSCIVFKTDSIWHLDFTLNSNGEASYPTRPVNNGTGCIATQSVQLIENSPFFLDKRGIYSLNQSNIKDEKNIELVSEKVNKSYFNGQHGLLQESNLENVVTVDYDSKYIVCVNGRCYVFDYLYKVWYIWNNINANCFLEYNSSLYLGDNNGTIHKFKIATDMDSFDDNGTAIHTYWKSKIFDFGAGERRKLVNKLFFSMNTASRSSVDLYYYNEENELNYVDRTLLDLFNYATLDYSRFCYACTPYPVENMKKIKAKKIVYFQVVFDNNYSNESLELLSLTMTWRLQNYVK